MQVFVKWEAFETITGDDEVQDLRAAVGKQVQHILKSGKSSAGGVFADGRAGFFVLEVNSAEEVIGLLGGAILDHFRVESHPLISYEALGKFFEKEARG